MIEADLTVPVGSTVGGSVTEVDVLAYLDANDIVRPTVPVPLPKPTAAEATVIVQPLIAAGLPLMPLIHGIKDPASKGWPGNAPMTEAEAVGHLTVGGNLGINLGMSSIVVIDSEDAAATAMFVEAGFIPTVYTANAQDPTNAKKFGGAHFYLRIPEGVDVASVETRLGRRVGGGVVDLLGGIGRYAVGPGTRLDNTPGYAYTYAAGGRFDPAAGVSEFQTAPLWLFSRDAECQPEFAALHGQMGPRPPRVRVPNPNADRVTAQIDEIDWSEWIGGDPRVNIIGTDGECGCDVFHWRGASHARSGILHEGCDVGCGVHVFSGTLTAEWGRTHGSRLDFAAFLRGVTALGPLMAEFGIEQSAGLGVVEPPSAAPAIGAAPQLRAVPGVGDTRGAAGMPVLPPGVVPPQLIQPFTRATRPGPFPIDALPEPLRSHAEWVMDAVAVPAELVGTMYLPVLAAACGRGVISARPGWTEHGAIWVIVVADPSARKSPVLKLISDPLKPAKTALEKATAAIRSRASAEVTALEEALEKATSAYRNAYKASVTGGAGPVPVEPGTPLVGPAPAAVVSVRPAADGGVLGPTPAIGSVAGAGPGGAVSGADLTGLRDAMQDLESKLRDARDRIPSRVLLSFGNATDAAMQRALRDCHGTGFMLVPEAGTWFEQLSKGDDPHSTARDYLQAYDGEPISVLREGRGEFLIDDPYLNMLLVMQPDPLQRGLTPDREGRRRLVGNGAWARLGVSRVDSCEPDDFIREIPDGGAVAEAYSAIIQREFLRSYGRRVPLRFGIDPEGRDMLAGIYDWVERIKVAHAALPDGASMSMEWGKAVGRCLRIARVFAQIQLTDAELCEDCEHLIGVDALRSAWHITEWMLQSAAWAMGGAKADSEGEMLAAAIRWLRVRLAKDGALPYRTLYGNKKFKAKSEATHRPWLIEAIEWLEDAGEVAVTPGVAISNATVTPTAALGTAELPTAA